MLPPIPRWATAIPTTFIRSSTIRVSAASFEAVKVVMEETAAAEAMALEKGMIVLSTAVAGGPFIGLLGTVWGVMETFAGIANAGAASLTAMAPGVAGALICTVIGLLVAIPGDVQLQFHGHHHSGHHPGAGRICQPFSPTRWNIATWTTVRLSDEIRDANEVLATRIVERHESGSTSLPPQAWPGKMP